MRFLSTEWAVTQQEFIVIMKEYSRDLRVAGVIQQELASIIQQQIDFRPLGMITISTVKISKDLKHAKIYVTFINNSIPQEQALHTLNQATSMLRRELARKVVLRYMPNLRFYYDESLEKGNRLNTLINQGLATKKGTEGEDH